MKRFLALLGLGILFNVGAVKAAENSTANQTMPVFAESYRIGDTAFVRSLDVDHLTNTLWVGSSLGAIEVDLNTKDMRNFYNRKSGLANEYIFAIDTDKAGKVWMGTNAGGFSTLLNNEWKTYFPKDGLADFWVYAFAFEGDDYVWIGTWDGVSRFDRATGEFTTFREELINVWVYGLAIGKDGRVWHGTEGGVSVYDNGNWTSWNHKDGLGAPNVNRLDSSSNTGLGTRTRHDLTITSNENSNTYNPDYVFAVHVDQRDENIWFGTWGGGVSRFNGKDTWKSFSTLEGLSGNIVYSMAQESDGTMWFGTNNGVTRYDGKTWSTISTKDGLLNSHVYAIAIDGQGMLWFGTQGGVTRFSYKN